MADEAVLIYETQIPIGFTCSNTTGIEKGTILKMTDPMTASITAAGAANDIVAGIAATEKIASDGKTKISVYRGGVFRSKISGSVTIGDPLVIGDVNVIQTAAVNAEQIIGIALETGTTGETIFWQLNPTVMQLA